MSIWSSIYFRLFLTWLGGIDAGLFLAGHNMVMGFLFLLGSLLAFMSCVNRIRQGGIS